MGSGKPRIMTKTVLLTLGRLPKALDFARAFHQTGWRVVVAEPFKAHLTGQSKCVSQSFVVPAPCDGKQAYLEALAAVVIAQSVDLVLPLSEETMHVAGLATLLPEHVRVYVPETTRLMTLHDKAAFIDLAASHGLAVPETALLGSEGARTLAAASDYVIKPVYSCSGRGVSLHKSGEPLPKTWGEKAIVQAQLSGDQYSTFAIAEAGKIIINVVYRGTIMSGSVAVAFERVAMPAIDLWVEKFVAAIGHSGFISFDFFVDELGVARAIECNPRVTSGVHFIENKGLADAILSPQTANLTLKPNRPLMQFYSTLTEVQGSMFRRGFFAKFKAMWAARDVTWQADDPMPLVTMPIVAFPMILRCIKTGKTFGEVFTDDIAWFEGERLATEKEH
jgi:predicted ATP-grasp superfamily ATP-dependent carboligase